MVSDGTMCLHIAVFFHRSEVLQHNVYADSILTDTLSSLIAPAAVELADATRHPPPLISSITVVFTRCAIVVSIRGAGEVSMQRRRQHWTSSHCKGNTVDLKHTPVGLMSLSLFHFNMMNRNMQVSQLTLNTDNKLAGGSVPGLIVHFITNNIHSLVEVGARLWAH